MVSFDRSQFRKGKEEIEMDDTAMAQRFIREIGGGDYVNTMIGNACAFLKRMFPHEGEPKKQWTERRLLAWWRNETDIVRHWQMTELYEGSIAAKAEREALNEARKEYRAFIARQSRLAALIEHQDEAFHSASIDALRGQMGRVDLPGNSGDR